MKRDMIMIIAAVGALHAFAALASAATVLPDPTHIWDENSAGGVRLGPYHPHHPPGLGAPMIPAGGPAIHTVQENRLKDPPNEGGGGEIGSPEGLSAPLLWSAPGFIISLPGLDGVASPGIAPAILIGPSIGAALGVDTTPLSAVNDHPIGLAPRGGAVPVPSAISALALAWLGGSRRRRRS